MDRATNEGLPKLISHHLGTKGRDRCLARSARPTAATCIADCPTARQTSLLTQRAQPNAGGPAKSDFPQTRNQRTGQRWRTLRAPSGCDGIPHYFMPNLISHKPGTKGQDRGRAGCALPAAWPASSLTQHAQPFARGSAKSDFPQSRNQRPGQRQAGHAALAQLQPCARLTAQRLTRILTRPTCTGQRLRVCQI
jgi:hypothetical protein